MANNEEYKVDLGKWGTFTVGGLLAAVLTAGLMQFAECSQEEPADPDAGVEQPAPDAGAPEVPAPDAGEPAEPELPDAGEPAPEEPATF